MKINEKRNADGKIILEAYASAKEVNDAFATAYLMFVNKMGLSPEKGKTVNQVVEEKLGIKDLDSIVRDSALQELIPQAINKCGVLPAYPPKVTSASLHRGADATFKLELLPKISYELTSYGPVSITVAPFEIDQTLVDRQLERLAAKNPQYVRSADQHEVRDGDCVLLEMESFEGQRRIVGLSTPARTYSVGKGFMPKSFDDELLGMNPGETKTFDFEGPDVDARGNETTMRVKTTVRVIEIQDEIVPEVTDEWVATYMPIFKSAADLRADIERSLTEKTREEYDGYCRQLAIEQLADRFVGRIPDEAYESMRENMMAQLGQSLSEQGMSFEDYVKQQGGEQQFSMMAMMQVREMLVQGYVLDALYEHEKLKATDEDYLAAAKQINPKGKPEETRRQLEASGRGFILQETAMRHRASTYLMEHADITVAAA